MKDRKFVAFFPSLYRLSGNPYWRLLARSLEKHNVAVIKNNPDTISLKWLEKHKNISVLHFHYIQAAYAYENDYARLRWVLRFFRNLMIARILGYRIVWTMHNRRPSHPLQPAWVERLAHYIIAKNSDVVIVHCQFAASLVQKLYGRKSNIYPMAHPNYIGVYPNSINRIRARRELGIDEGVENKVIVYFGGIRPNKGIEALIHAFKRFSSSSVKLLIAGKPQVDGKYVHRLKMIARGDSRIMIKDEWIPDSRVQIFLNASDLVVLPFSEVLTSGSTILAMSFRKPVIVPRIGCLPELVPKDAGWCYEPGDPDALFQTIRTALESDLEAMGDRAYQAVSSFSWDDFAQQTLLAYGMSTG